MPARPKLETLLLERGLVSAEQVDRIRLRMQQEGVTFLDVIKREKLILPEALAQVRAEAAGLPYVDVRSVAVNKQANKHIPRHAAARYRFAALDIREDNLVVAMESPEDWQARDAVRFIAKQQGLKLDIHVASKEGIDRLIGGTAEVQAEIGGALHDFGQELADLNMTSRDEKDLEKYIEEAPVTKVVAVIIRHALEGRASDIHIEPTETDLRIRYRIDGKLHTTLLLPMRVHAPIVSRIKILANLKIDEARLPQDGRFSSRSEGQAFDFRVSTMPTTYGEKVALRILDKSRGTRSFAELGLVGRQQDLFTEHLRAPHGIILLSGPTGSGKSTTLLAGLSLINSPDVNITTLEDPVEYEIEGISQTQINPDIGLTFASGLRNILRQDPDVIMVGEIRDTETATLAVHASLTGHLVISTIHTNDALGAIPRLVDIGIDPFLLTATLRVVAAQRLVTKLCPHCKEEVAIPPAVLERMVRELERVPADMKSKPNQQQPRVLFKAVGCAKCNDVGAIGRLGIYEVVPLTRKLRSAINDAAAYDILRDVARHEGYITLRQDGLLKALAGEIQYEEVLRVTSEAAQA